MHEAGSNITVTFDMEDGEGIPTVVGAANPFWVAFEDAVIESYVFSHFLHKNFTFPHSLYFSIQESIENYWDYSNIIQVEKILFFFVFQEPNGRSTCSWSCFGLSIYSQGKVKCFSCDFYFHILNLKIKS